VYAATSVGNFAVCQLIGRGTTTPDPAKKGSANLQNRVRGASDRPNPGLSSPAYNQLSSKHLVSFLGLPFREARGATDLTGHSTVFLESKALTRNTTLAVWPALLVRKLNVPILFDCAKDVATLNDRTNRIPNSFITAKGITSELTGRAEASANREVSGFQGALIDSTAPLLLALRKLTPIDKSPLND